MTQCTGWIGCRRGYRRSLSGMLANGGSNRSWRHAGARVRISRCFKGPLMELRCGHSLRSGIGSTFRSMPGLKWTGE